MCKSYKRSALVIKSVYEIYAIHKTNFSTLNLKEGG
jgi:hypothetical protein